MWIYHLLWQRIKREASISFLIGEAKADFYLLNEIEESSQCIDTWRIEKQEDAGAISSSVMILQGVQGICLAGNVVEWDMND